MSQRPGNAGFLGRFLTPFFGGFYYLVNTRNNCEQMPVKDNINHAAKQFQSEGCTLSYDEQSRVVTAAKSGTQRRYNLPPLSKANQYAVPGWFFAGIWEDMELAWRKNELDYYYLSGWGFTMPDKSQVWLKSLPSDSSKVLIYHFGNFYIADEANNLRAESRLPAHADLVTSLPNGSLYHIIMLFEENGWYDKSEYALPSQNITSYRV